ncbi:MAG: FAD-dependent thymidylate synthase [Candidatus Pacearchaeota archaeon]
MNNKCIKLTGMLLPVNGDDPEAFATSGARGCFSEKPSFKIQEDEEKREDYNQRKELIFRETSGRGHGAVLDQSAFLFSADNLSRASTLFLCAPQYASHLQQSLRRATAERGFVNADKDADKLMSHQFRLYEKMLEGGIPPEDARFILPLGTKTAIQTKLDARELIHLYSMSKRANAPDEVKDTVREMYRLAQEVAPRMMEDRENSMEVLSWLPAPQLFALDNKTIENLVRSAQDKVTLLGSETILIDKDEIEQAIKKRNEALLSCLKHVHFTYLAPMSIATFHQATRQRTWDQSVQAIPNAVRKRQYVTPPTISETRFKTPYSSLLNDSFDYANANTHPNSFLALPHALEVYDIIHINGWNAIHSIAKRTCAKAQWEIRDIACKMADEIKKVYPELGEFIGPQCEVYSRCPESNPCKTDFR